MQKKNSKPISVPTARANEAWREVSLGDLVESAVDGPFGSNLKTEHYVDEPGVRVIRLQNIELGWFNESDRAWVSEKHARRLRKHGVQAGDVIVASLGDENHPVARACLYPEGQPQAIVKADCFRLRLDRRAALPGFVMRVLSCPMTRRGINRLVQGVTRDRINLGNLLRFRLNLPPLLEQYRIVEILDAFDKAIQATEQAITTLREVKLGLLDDLLVRGIDQNGELPDPQTKPGGRSQQSWRAVQLGEVVPQADYGISVALSDSGEVPVLRMNNLVEGEVDLSQLKFCNSRMARQVTLMTGDVLFNRTNSIEHVGRTAIWRDQLPLASFASYVVRLVPDRARLDPEFLNLWLNLRSTQIKIRQWATPGVQQVNINPSNLRKAVIVMPSSLEKQRQLVGFVSEHDQRIRAEGRFLEKLRSVVKGLTDDLLTGRVRVSSIE